MATGAGVKLDQAAATIVATATATPPYVLERDDVKQAVAHIFRLEPRRLAGLMALYDHAQVDRRYSALPLDEVVACRSLTDKMADYRQHAVALGSQVARTCLDRASVAPSDVDLVISVSCTGYMVPSLDAYLVSELGLRPNVRRLPITELGCVGGAAALARAADFARANPGSHVLVVAVELSSLTFQRDDASDANLVSCAFFGDGAAAALIAGGAHRHGRAGSSGSRGAPVADRRVAGMGMRVIDTESYLVPASLDAMGFDLREGGFHMVLSKDVPEILRRNIRELVDGFLARNGLTRSDLAVFALHPGGRKILEHLEDELGLDRATTQPSWDILRDFGNLSSATILFVLDKWQRARRPPAGAYGIAMGFGPGVSAELLLLQWA